MDNWQPKCAPPRGLVRPVAIDREGAAGPTPGKARGPRWRRTSPGLFVPVDTPISPEQRVLESWAGVPHSAVTGWAALRLYGGGFFDGRGGDVRSTMDVPLVIAASFRPRPRAGVRILRVKDPPTAFSRHGVPVVMPERAVVDAMRLVNDERTATAVLDMAAAAEITSIERVRRYLLDTPPRTGGAQVHRALALGSERSRSPRETELRLIWTLDCSLPTPLVNQPVFTPGGELIGVADLFDPSAGVAGEYDGEHHRSRARHRRDVQRAEGFRDAGIETFVVVAGDSRAVVVRRILAAYGRARARTTRGRGWTLSGGDWDDAGEPTMRLDDKLNYREEMAAVYADLDAQPLVGA